jgi:hypothetical protein
MFMYWPGSPRGGAAGMLAAGWGGGADGVFAAQAPRAKANDSMTTRRIMLRVLHQRRRDLQGSLSGV